MSTADRWPRIRAFTLLELMTVIIVISILILLLLQVSSGIRSRAERINCTANLKNLYIGAAAYVADKGQWPQIPARLIQSNPHQYARLWIDALQPYGLSQINWICPTQQWMLGSPDLSDKENVRVDYNATPFDSRSITPRLWPTQPWFVEHASVHEGGPLLILANGRVMTLEEATGKRQMTFRTRQ